MEEFDVDIEFHPIKEETKDYTLPLFENVVNPLDIATPTSKDHEDSIHRFCRLCLQEQSDMVPLNSHFNSEMIPAMIFVLTGSDLVLRGNLPKNVCKKCLTKLDYALNVRKEFIESERKLYCYLAECNNTSLLACLEINQLSPKDCEVFYNKIVTDELVNSSPIDNVSICDQKIDLGSEDEAVKSDDSDGIGKSFSRKNVHLNKQSDNDEFNADSIESEDDELLVAIKSPAKKQVPRTNTATIDKPDPNLCYICKEKLENVDALNLHLHKHVDMVPYTCEPCVSEGGTAKKLTTFIQLHRHFKMHAGSIPCSKCPHRFWNRTALYNHTRNEHSTEHTCEICGTKLKSKKCYSNHMRSHKALDQGKYACSFCEKRFGTKVHKIRHERCHTNERPYQCRYCSKSFSTETTQSAHERIHTGEKGFRCELCEKCFRSQNHLWQHVACQHEPQNGMSPKNQINPLKFSEKKMCPFEGCNFSTDIRSQYYTHKAMHDPRFRCTVCFKQFASQQQIDYHSYEHTGIKPFCCEICGMVFRKLQLLNDHMNGHNNVRPHACEICGQKFVRKSHLMNHLSKHSDERKFSCKQCDKAFKYQVDAWRHKKIHDAEVTS